MTGRPEAQQVSNRYGPPIIDDFGPLASWRAGYDPTPPPRRYLGPDPGRRVAACSHWNAAVDVAIRAKLRPQLGPVDYPSEHDDETPITEAMARRHAAAASALRPW